MPLRFKTEEQYESWKKLVSILKERNLGQPKAESVGATPSIDSEEVRQKSDKALEEQEKISESLTKKDGDGLAAIAGKIYDELEDQSDSLVKIVKQTKDQSDALAGLASTAEISKGPIEKMVSFAADLKKKLSPENVRETGLRGAEKAFKKVPLVGGLFQRAREKETWIKTQMKVDPSLSRERLKGEWGAYKESTRDVQKASKEYEDTRKQFGMGDSAFAKTAKGKELIETQKRATEKYAQYERRAKFVIDESDGTEPESEKLKVTGESGTRKTSKDAEKSEALHKVEDYSDEQIQLLREIAENTRPVPVAGGAKARAIAPAGTPGSTSYASRQPQATKAGGFGGRLKGIADGMVGAAKGVGAIGASLIVLSVGLKSMSAVDLQSILKATLAIGGLVTVSKLMGDNVGTMLKGALGLAAIGGAMWLASKGFEAFTDIDWETLAKAGIAIGGIAAMGAVIGGAAAPILLGAVAIAGLGAAVWVLGEGLQAVGEAVDSFVSSIERLGDIDGSNLIAVGAGLAAVAAGMVAFGAANAVAGVTNLVSGFLGAITPGKTPVEQLLEIAEAGPNIQAAGTGIQSFAEGLTKFSAVDKDKLEIIKDLPNDKIIALGVAIGSAQTANAVYGASAENAGAAVAGGGGTTNNVVAPTTVNNTTNTTGGFKPDVRNQDSSFKRMLDNRYVAV